jgi:hypothetical protein
MNQIEGCMSSSKEFSLLFKSVSYLGEGGFGLVLSCIDLEDN